MSEETHPERQGWSDDRAVLTFNCPRFTAYCSPVAKGAVYVDDVQVSDDSYLQRRRFGAPFPFDIVFHDVYPSKGEVEPLTKYLGGAFESIFVRVVTEIEQTISESDDPLGAIMDMSLEPPFTNGDEDDD